MGDDRGVRPRGLVPRAPSYGTRSSELMTGDEAKCLRSRSPSSAVAREAHRRHVAPGCHLASCVLVGRPPDEGAVALGSPGLVRRCVQDGAVSPMVVHREPSDDVAAIDVRRGTPDDATSLHALAADPHHSLSQRRICRTVVPSVTAEELVALRVTDESPATDAVTQRPSRVRPARRGRGTQGRMDRPSWTSPTRSPSSPVAAGASARPSPSPTPSTAPTS